MVWAGLTLNFLKTCDRHADSPWPPFRKDLWSQICSQQMVILFVDGLSWKTQRQWIIEGVCGRLRNSPIRCPHSEPVNLLPEMAKKDLANVMTLRALGREIILDYLVNSKGNPKGPCRREAGGSESKKECDDGTTERGMWWWGQRQQWCILKMEEGP